MEQTQRARQRALCIAALPEGENLQELGELLRTAGVAVVGELVQRRESRTRTRIWAREGRGRRRRPRGRATRT